MARLPVLIRQNQVFELVLAGKTHTEIVAKLKVSEDTIARDMKAISDQVESLVKERSGEILAAAIATIGEVLMNARSEYAADLKRERDWFAGKFDYQTQDETVKMLGLNAPKPRKGRRRNGEAEAPEQAGEEPGLVLETTTKVSMVRPPWRSSRSQWLTIMLQATRELAELAQLKTIVVQHKGSIALTEQGEQGAEEKLTAWRTRMQEQLKLNTAPAPPMPASSQMNTG